MNKAFKKFLFYYAIPGTVLVTGWNLYQYLEAPDTLTMEQVAELLADKGILRTDYAAALLGAAKDGNQELATLLVQVLPDAPPADEENNTPLHLSAAAGHHEITALLVSAYGQNAINAKNKKEQTALHLAAEKGHAACAEILLNAHAYPNTTDELGYSALHYAAQNGHLACVQLLLKHGADAKKIAFDGKSIADVAAAHAHCADLLQKHIAAMAPTPQALPAEELSPEEQLLEAIRNKHADTVQQLLENGVSPNCSNEQRNSAVIEATIANTPEVLRLLITKGGDVEADSATGDKALHIAAANGYDACMDVLLSYHANVNATNRQGETALLQAVQQQRRTCISKLLEIGANADSLSKNDLSPLGIAAKDGQADIVAELIRHGANVNLYAGNRTPLMLAAASGQQECLRLLLDAGAQITAAPDNFCTALHFAAEKGHTACVETLLQAGAAVNAANNNSETALHIANAYGYQECLTALLQGGADPNQRDGADFTPLHTATSKGNFDCARILLRHGAELNTIQLDGHTPLQRATLHNDRTIVNFLLEEGADISIQDEQQRTAIDIARNEHHTEVLRILARHALKTRQHANYNDIEAFCQAIKNDDSETVRLFIDAGLPLNESEDNAVRAFYTAAHNGRPAQLQILLDAGVSPQVTQFNTLSLYHEAISNADSIRVLLRVLPDFGSLNNAGQTAKELAQIRQYQESVSVFESAEWLQNAGHQPAHYDEDLLVAARKSDHRTLQHLLNVGARTEYRNDEGQTAVHLAAQARQVTCLKRLLEAHANPNTTDHQNMTPLMLATINNKASFVRTLLAAGADLSVYYLDDTPVTMAAKKGHIECLQFILDAGADVNSRDKHDKTLLHIAAEKGDIKMLHVLYERGADINSKSAKEPFLHAMIRGCSNAECQELLQREDLDTFAENDNGENAMHVAAAHGKIPVMVLLTAQNHLFSERDQLSMTPLHHAAMHGQTEVVKQLIEVKVDLNSRDHRGRSALDLAIEFKHTDCENLLRQANARAYSEEK
ncbi:MAG: hypothetical protein E7033_02710 [Akkermansiaceae bacterium]|nr:hypothetical protein [Akkermansiaceae bacterium]